MKRGTALLAMGILVVALAALAHADDSHCQSDCEFMNKNCGMCQNDKTSQYEICDASGLWSDTTAQVAVGSKEVTSRVWDCDQINSYWVGQISQESGMSVAGCTCESMFNQCLKQAYSSFTECVNQNDDSTPYNIKEERCAQSADSTGKECAVNAADCYNGYMPDFCGVKTQSCIAACKAREKPSAPDLGQVQSTFESNNSTVQPEPEPQQPAPPAAPVQPSAFPCPALLAMLAATAFAFARKPGAPASN